MSSKCQFLKAIIKISEDVSELHWLTGVYRSAMTMEANGVKVVREWRQIRPSWW